MRRVVAATLLVLGASGCDLEQAALLNSVSVHHETPPGHVIDVFLAVDGVSHPALLDARRQGAFATFDVARSIPMFPATSDASWTRILRTQQMGGYEFTYYDERLDAVQNGGLDGLLGHAVPHRRHSDEFPYYDAFDVHGSGYLDSAEKYGDPKGAFSRALDHLFVTLAGRVTTQSVFTAYLLETDVVSHSEDPADAVSMLVKLSERIEAFREQHPDVTMRFTLFSDHGTDAVAKPVGNFVTQAQILEGVGVTPASSFEEASARRLAVWAVAPEHTRVTYGILHTAPELILPVALRVSTSPAVDLVVARAVQPADAPIAEEWVSLVLDGHEVARFGFDPATDTYWLPASADWARIDVTLVPHSAERWIAFSDEALFHATVDRRYPDLFFRARTALLPLSVRNAAPIVFSLRDSYALKGFVIPFADEAGAAGSHGAMGGQGSEAVLLTDAREIPEHVRAEELLDLFPELDAYLDERGLARTASDRNAAVVRSETVSRQLAGDADARAGMGAVGAW